MKKIKNETTTHPGLHRTSGHRAATGHWPWVFHALLLRQTSWRQRRRNGGGWWDEWKGFGQRPVMMVTWVLGEVTPHQSLELNHQLVTMIAVWYVPGIPCNFLNPRKLHHTPISHTPTNPPRELCKESRLKKPVGNGCSGCVPFRCVETTLESWGPYKMAENIEITWAETLVPLLKVVYF